MVLSPRWPALSVIAIPPQLPACGCPQSDTDTKTDGHEMALATAPDALSFRLVKVAKPLEVPAAMRLPPLIVIGPPSAFTTSPAFTVSVVPSRVRPPSSKYPSGFVVALAPGVIQVRLLVTVPSNAIESRPLPLPTFPRTFRAKSADTFGR